MVTCLTVLAALLLVASHCHGSITLNPPHLTFDENVTTVTLSFTCEIPRYLKTANVIALYMSRNGENLGIAEEQMPPKLNENTINAFITGGIVNDSITITMTQASCRDGGEYLCEIMYLILGSAAKINIYREKLYVSVKPGRTVAMTASPHKPVYSLNDFVQLSCSSLIGSNNLFLEIRWIWEYMDYGQNEIWIKYPDNKISNDPPIFTNISCQNRQVSSISRTLTLEDIRRTYRCYLTWKGIVYTENPPTYLFNMSDALNKLAASNAREGFADGIPWWIIAAAAGGGVILIIFLGTVIFLLNRKPKNKKRNKKEDTSEGEDETSNASPRSASQTIKTFLHLDTIPEKESGLTSDKESAIEVTGASSRG